MKFDDFIDRIYSADKPGPARVDLHASINRRIENRLLGFRTMFYRAALAFAVSLSVMFVVLFTFHPQSHGTAGPSEQAVMATGVEMLRDIDLYEHFDIISNLDSLEGGQNL